MKPSGINKNHRFRMIRFHGPATSKPGTSVPLSTGNLLHEMTAGTAAYLCLLILTGKKTFNSLAYEN